MNEPIFRFSETDDALIILYRREGLPDQDVAEYLNMSISTLRARQAQLAKGTVADARH